MFLSGYRSNPSEKKHRSVHIVLQGLLYMPLKHDKNRRLTSSWAPVLVSIDLSSQRKHLAHDWPRTARPHVCSDMYLCIKIYVHPYISYQDISIFEGVHIYPYTCVHSQRNGYHIMYINKWKYTNIYIESIQYTSVYMFYTCFMNVQSIISRCYNHPGPLRIWYWTIPQRCRTLVSSMHSRMATI